jgi:gamma-glutamyltranspeptidase/glutathione hydrolase
MVATSQPLAAQAGVSILEGGGNAFDAAVAAAAALAVVEPTGGGLGGDAVCLGFVAQTREVFGLNGTGRSPMGLSRDEVAAAGGVPQRGPLSVTVPGAVMAWSDLIARYGRLGLPAVLAPAIEVARSGFPVSELIADSWAASATLLAGTEAGKRHYLPDGQPPRAGQVVRLPALGAALLEIATAGADVVYRGDIGADIVACVREAGGRLEASDLAAHHSTFDTPIGVDWDGLTIWECPPNTQGLAALAAIAAAREAPAAPWGSFDHVHHLVEAMKWGIACARQWVADPMHAPVDAGELVASSYERFLGARQDRNRSALLADLELRASVPLSGGDTVYVSAVDADGNACSFIQSNCMGFGSGLVTSRTAIPLQNRGAGFTLAPGHGNDYAPAKRPFHTIIPALGTDGDGNLRLCFGVMGGHMQPQGHLQVVCNMRRYGMDPQRALDAPRFQITPDYRVALEPGFAATLHREMADAGHTMVAPDELPPPGSFGGGQIVAVTDSVRVGGSDPRKDGCAIAQMPPGARPRVM